MSKESVIYASPVADKVITSAEDTPAYAVLQKFNLLDTRFRKESFDEIFTSIDLKPNSSKSHTITKRFKWGVYFTPFCGLIVYVSNFMI